MFYNQLLSNQKERDVIWIYFPKVFHKYPHHCFMQFLAISIHSSSKTNCNARDKFWNTSWKKMVVRPCTWNPASIFEETSLTAEKNHKHSFLPISAGEGIKARNTFAICLLSTFLHEEKCPLRCWGKNFSPWFWSKRVGTSRKTKVIFKLWHFQQIKFALRAVKRNKSLLETVLTKSIGSHRDDEMQRVVLEKKHLLFLKETLYTEQFFPRTA